MRLSVLDNLINLLGTKKCAEEFSALVGLAQHTNDPLVLAENPIYAAMLEDRLNDTAATDGQQTKNSGINATSK